MILAAMLVAALADWVPARWISSDPQSLGLLDGTGVNCVLLSGAQLNEKLVQSATAHGVATVAVVRPGSGAIEDAGRAAALAVNGVALEGDFAPAALADIRALLSSRGIAAIELPSRQKIRLDTNDPIAGTSQGLWPGLEIEHGGKVMSGPTSNPWVDTNTGFLHFLRAAMKGSLWLGYSPPANMAVPVERYAIAIADAEAAGAHWIITLDDDFRSRLAGADPRAVRDWKRLGGYIKFYEDRREWRDYRPFARMALVQDAGSGGLLSAGLLDLMAAQHVDARALPPGRIGGDDLRGLRTVINIDGVGGLSEGPRRSLDDFASSGGVRIDAPPGWKLGADQAGSVSPSRKQLERIQDIWEILYNATARRNFGARTFNTAGILFNVLASPDEKRLLVHLVNYTQYAAESITVHALGTWRAARLYTVDGSVRELAVYPVKDGTGADLDKLDTVATLVFE